MFNYNKKAPYRNYLDQPDETDPTWYSYSRPTKQPYARYKLHICIPISAFVNVQDKIHHILHMALKNHWIAQYKTLDVILALEENPSTSDWEILRAMHNPFVIYLNDNYDHKNFLNIARMCYDIEDVLLKFPPEENSFHAPSDLLLMHHFTFRQAFLNADKTKTLYIKAFDIRYIDQLAREGKQSTYYREFYNLCMGHYPPLVEIKTEESTSNQTNFVSAENKKTEINFLRKSPQAVTKQETPAIDEINVKAKEAGMRKKSI